MHDLSGKTFVVTGASAGIGRATALALAERGATLALVARESSRLRAVAAAVERFDVARALVFPANLALIADTRRVGRELSRALGTIDVLINNVGAVFPERVLTQEGIERTFALNHVGHFVLTSQLLEALKSANAPRVVEVSSQVHASTLALDAIVTGEDYAGLPAYRASKLANLLFVHELQRRHGAWLTTAALHPGVVDTGLLAEYDRAALMESEAARPTPSRARTVLRRAVQVAKHVTGVAHRTHGISTSDGAKTSVFVATDARVSAAPGRYWRDSALAAARPAATDDELALALWERTDALVASIGTA